MEISEELEKAIMDAFGIPRFGVITYDIRDKHGQRIGETSIRALWVIKLSSPPGSLIMAGILFYDYTNSSQSYKAIILLPNDGHPSYKLPAHAKHKTVDLEWPCPLTKAMQNVNILPFDESFQDIHISFGLYTATNYHSARYSYFGFLKDPTLRRLHDAVLSNVQQIAQAYNNRELNRYLNRYIRVE